MTPSAPWSRGSAAGSLAKRPIARQPNPVRGRPARSVRYTSADDVNTEGWIVGDRRPARPGLAAERARTDPARAEMRIIRTTVRPEPVRTESW